MNLKKARPREKIINNALASIKVESYKQIIRMLRIKFENFDSKNNNKTRKAATFF
ncbi:MAG: hypothetical protein LBQ13_01875 [Endomicrobium sp.]|nr:hypothetical protein [Endomicrobium sp.]